MSFGAPLTHAALAVTAIARFRSTFHDGRGTVTAELSPSPGPRWRALAEAGLARFAATFGVQPTLVEDVIVVPTTTEELITTEMALTMLVRFTNELEQADEAENAGPSLA